MPHSVVDFIKNAGLVTLLNFLIVLVVVFAGLVLFFFAPTRSAMRWFLFIAIVPLASGMLALYLKFKYAGVVMKGMATPEFIAANKREGVIDAIAGSTAAMAILLLGTLCRRLNRKLDG